MHTVTVELGDRSYPIFIGHGLLRETELLKQYTPGRQVMIVTNETIAPLYLDAVKNSFADSELATIVLPDGEKYKNLDILNTIFDALLEHRFNRGCTLVALGGGVIGDLTGFAAACYQRGVAFLQVPTTLLAQVDSSVGGKTGVNHELGKNMIGAFHQPACVLIDTNTLDTLDKRQFAAGLAEVIKYGLIRDTEFLTWLEQNIDALVARDKAALARAIECSCALKAEIVAADERESGQRALLNLGHTFGHAIETGTGYGTWLHGEAVAAGMLMAADLSARHGWISAKDVDRIRNLLQRAGLPIHTPREMNAARFRELMAVDKKAVDGGLRLILLRSVGNAFVSSDFEDRLLTETLTAVEQ